MMAQKWNDIRFRLIYYRFDHTDIPHGSHHVNELQTVRPHQQLGASIILPICTLHLDAQFSSSSVRHVLD